MTRITSRYIWQHPQQAVETSLLVTLSAQNPAVVHASYSGQSNSLLTRQTMKASFLLMMAAMTLVTSSCSMPSSAQVADRYQQAFRLYVEYTLPNSHARPKGFDLSAHLATIKEQRCRLVRGLNPS